MEFCISVLIRTALSVAVGGIIGSERAKHGRAAGMRTHILVCLGACLTSLTSLFVANTLGVSGDVFRIPAQVISGVGFLGAGIIILKNNNVITGLTTAAGVWTTGAIGIAMGYGFYSGAAIGTVFFLIANLLFTKFEKQKKMTEVIYVEIDDMSRTNAIIGELSSRIHTPFSFHVTPPKSETQGHLGITVVIDKRKNVALADLCQIDNVLYAVEDA